MPRLLNLDSFIEHSSDLLAAFPTTTTLSITYYNVEKKFAEPRRSHKSDKTHAVRVKLFEPHSGKCLTYNTFRIKELSRILSFIGPRGVNVVTKTKEADKNKHTPGLASLMSNVKYEEEETAAVVGATGGTIVSSNKESTPAVEEPKTETSGKKKNKKKKKKN